MPKIIHAIIEAEGFRTPYWDCSFQLKKALVMHISKNFEICQKKCFYHVKFHFRLFFSIFQKWHLEGPRTFFKGIRGKKLFYMLILNKNERFFVSKGTFHWNYSFKYGISKIYIIVKMNKNKNLKISIIQTNNIFIKKCYCRSKRNMVNFDF